MELKQAFGMALKSHRVRKGLTQEDFSVVSSRTFLSSLERGVKGATLEKIDGLASVIFDARHRAAMLETTHQSWQALG